MLGATEDGPQLTLLDVNGKARAGLDAFKEGPGFGLLDKNGKVLWRAP